MTGTGPAPLAWTVTEPVASLTATVLGGVFFSSSAAASSSSGFAYASPHSVRVFAGAASYWAIALASAASPGIVLSGLSTKSFAVSIGWLTPSQRCG